MITTQLLSRRSHNFLPIEIRLAIWRFTLPPPRRLLREERRTDPIALYINRESRQLALSYYKRYDFDTKLTWLLEGPGDTTLNPRYIDYSVDFIHDRDLPYFAKELAENLISDFADSPDLEAIISGRLQERLRNMPRLRELLVVVHYRDAYEPFKQAESQMEKRLVSMKTNLVQRLFNRKTSNELEGHNVLWEIPNIVMEACKPCFRRRGGRYYANIWCRGRLG